MEHKRESQRNRERERENESDCYIAVAVLLKRSSGSGRTHLYIPAYRYVLAAESGSNVTLEQKERRIDFQQ